jgi:hypothetical protein
MDSSTQDRWNRLLHSHRVPTTDIREERDPAKLAALLHEIDGRLNRQLLLLGALCEVLEGAGLVNLAQLLSRMEQIDQRDGRADGRLSHATSCRCQACGRISSGPRNRCLYCGSGNLESWIEGLESPQG